MNKLNPARSLVSFPPGCSNKPLSLQYAHRCPKWAFASRRSLGLCSACYISRQESEHMSITRPASAQLTACRSADRLYWQFFFVFGLWCIMPAPMAFAQLFFCRAAQYGPSVGSSQYHFRTLWLTSSLTAWHVMWSHDARKLLYWRWLLDWQFFFLSRTNLAWWCQQPKIHWSGDKYRSHIYQFRPWWSQFTSTMFLMIRHMFQRWLSHCCKLVERGVMRYWVKFGVDNLHSIPAIDITLAKSPDRTIDEVV